MSLHAETQSLALRAARQMIADMARACGAPSAVLGDLEIAVGEILANAQRHAYHGGVGPIRVDVRCDERSIEIVIHDEGAPLVRAPQVPVAPGFGDQGSLGLYITRQLVDILEIKHPARDERGTAVRLVKRFDATPAH
jgi:anti-sigma regulatory factor (Ser/Thr protein kinase)